MELNGQEIAITGLSARLPGSMTFRDFWNNLMHGKESISRFTDEQIIANGVDAGALNDPRYVKASGALEDIEFFDAQFFGYSATEAQAMDPQVRIFHECAHAALEDAGCDPERYPGAIGVYAGAAPNLHWEALVAFASERDPAAAFDAASLYDKEMMATRVSYRLNLTGPSVYVSTACSTSLFAVHAACQGLLAGDCDIALAGGASVSAFQRRGYLYQPGMIASPDGHCRAFDHEAMGTVRGYGVGVVVLRLLEDALGDRDHIYAVIKGSASNNDGRAKVGYTAPSVIGQSDCIRTALQAADVDPETVTYIEAHGTGTALGDPVEIDALKRAFAGTTAAHCRVGSVKSNIGHLDAAAGIAGLIKTALSLYYKKLPPTLHVRRPNPRLGLDGSPFTLCTQAVDWPVGKYPRRAGVSSFGIGGTNVHLVLEQAPETATCAHDGRALIFPVSAKTERALSGRYQQLLEFLSTAPDAQIADAAFTLAQGRRSFRYRGAVVASSASQLRAALADETGRDVISGKAADVEPRVAFLFPGQGAQYIGMGKELYEREALFRTQFDECARQVRKLEPVDLAKCLFARGDEAANLLTETRVAQPLIFAFEVALARLLISWGIRPSSMCGHSLGEYACATLAGVFDRDEGIELVVRRARLMQSMPGGAMLAVGAPVEAVTPLLPASLSVAAVNAPTNTVVAGPGDVIAQFAQSLENREIACTLLHTSHAFHTSMMEAAAERFTEALRGRKFNPPTVPFISNVSGAWIGAEDASDPSYWARQIRATVRFSDGIRLMKQTAGTIFVEVGPGRTLTTLVHQHESGESKSPAYTTIRHPKERLSDYIHLLRQVAALWTHGVPVDFAAIDRTPRNRVSLPSYPFERKRYWSYVDRFIERTKATGTTVAASSFDLSASADSSDPASESIEETTGYTQEDREKCFYSPPATVMEDTLAKIWSELFGRDRLSVSDNFFELGGDSLKAITLVAMIEKRLGIVLSVQELFAYPVVRDLADFLTGDRIRRTVDEDFVVFNPGKPQRIFCLPPYVCYGIAYYDLAPKLAEISLWCFNHDHRHTDGIDHFVRTIEAVNESNPCLLYGFSAGGRIAYEIARRLEAGGSTVSDLILLDAFSRWKTIEQYSEESEKRRSEQLLEGYSYLLADNDKLKARAVKNLVDYSRLVHQVEVRDALAANIHLIKSEGLTPSSENADWIEYTINNTWEPFTRGEYREYQGFGEHWVMDTGEYGIKNAAIIHSILQRIAAV